MAFLPNGFTASFSLIDNGGNVTTKTYELRGVDYATAVTDTAAIIAALSAVSDSVIASYRITNNFENDSFAYPAAGIENENKASVTVLLDGLGAKKANFKIPAPKIGLFTSPSGPGANVIDVLDADLVAYADLFKSTGNCYISDGEDLASIVSGKRISAKSNNG